MAAKVSPRVEALVTQALELPEGERELVVRALGALPAERPQEAVDRHAVIAARVAEVHAGHVTGFSAEEVVQSLREELGL